MEHGEVIADSIDGGHVLIFQNRKLVNCFGTQRLVAFPCFSSVGGRKNGPLPSGNIAMLSVGKCYISQLNCERQFCAGPCRASIRRDTHLVEIGDASER